MKKLDRTCLVIVVIVSVICGYLVVHHGIRQQRQIHRENELLSRKLKDLDLADTNLKHLREVLNATKKELKVLNEQIPETARIGRVLKKIDSLMKQRKVMMINIKQLPPVKEKLYTRIPIQLAFKGSFVNIHHLLHDLETMNRILVMEKMNIIKANNDKQCQIDLTANVFER